MHVCIQCNVKVCNVLVGGWFCLKPAPAGPTHGTQLLFRTLPFSGGSGRVLGPPCAQPAFAAMGPLKGKPALPTKVLPEHLQPLKAVFDQLPLA